MKIGDKEFSVEIARNMSKVSIIAYDKE